MGNVALYIVKLCVLSYPLEDNCFFVLQEKADVTQKDIVDVSNDE